MIFTSRQGFTILETVLYIGLLVLILPAAVLALTRILVGQEGIQARVRMTEKAGIIFWELEEELLSSTAVDQVASTFGADNSVLVFTSDEGETVTLDRPTATVAFPGGNASVRRLRLQKNATVSYVTDADIDVETWRVERVEDRAGALIGLRVTLAIAMLSSQSSGPRSPSFERSTTIRLPP